MYRPPYVQVAMEGGITRWKAMTKFILLIAIIMLILSLSGGLFHTDPRTVSNGGEYYDDGSFVIPASRLGELRYREPTMNYHLYHSHSSSFRRGTVLDVLSVGSMTRIEYVSTTAPRKLYHSIFTLN
jgi:hypothetical protein